LLKTLLEKVLGGVRRIWRQEFETLPEEGTAARAKEVAHLEIVEAYLAKVA